MMNEDTDPRETPVEPRGIHEVLFGWRIPVLGLAVTVGLQPVKLLVVGNGTEADDASDAVLFGPIDGPPSQALGCVTVGASGAVYSQVREQISPKLLPPQPPVVLCFQ